MVSVNTGKCTDQINKYNVYAGRDVFAHREEERKSVYARIFPESGKSHL